FALCLRAGLWHADTDIDPDEVEHPDHPEHGGGATGAAFAPARAHGAATGSAAAPATADADTTSGPRSSNQLPPLVRPLPILVPLGLIASAAFIDLAGDAPTVVTFLGDANVALFIGLLIAFVMVRYSLGGDATENAVSSGLRTTGEILLITGIGGSLGAVI